MRSRSADRTAYRVALAGLGRVGLLYEEDRRLARRYPYPTHASAFAAHPRTQLVAAADPDPSRRAIAARRHGLTRLYADHRAMLEAETPDILAVCVPTEAHGTVVADAIAAGVRVVFCEKPFTSSLDQARALAARAEARGVSLAVNYFRRFDASHRALATLVAGGEIGEVQRVTGVYGNGLGNMGSHVVNLLLWYLGPAEWVTALDGLGGADPSPDLTIGFASGARASLVACDYRHYRILELHVLGTRGRLALANEGLDLRVHGVRPNAEVSGALQLAPRARRWPSTVGRAFLDAVDHLVDALDRGRTLRPMDALETHAVLDAARRSAQRHGARVEVAHTVFDHGRRPRRIARV